MASGNRSKSMKRSGRRKNRKKKHNLPSINSIPSELVMEVLARVSTFSTEDYFNAKESCKIFNEVAEENYVFRHVSIDKFPVILWPVNSKSCEKLLSFLNKCRESDNPESLYRQGVVDYFNYMRLESGIERLKKASNSGHKGALYVLAIILLLSGEDEFKQEGMQLLSNMKKSRMGRIKVKDYRENLKSILRIIWINTSLLLQKKTICCTMRNQHRKKNQWPIDEIDDDLQCDGCKCDLEVASIRNVLA